MDEVEDLRELMAQVGYHAEAGECLGAFYVGMSKRVNDPDVLFELSIRWMWHMWPNVEEEE